RVRGSLAVPIRALTLSAFVVQDRAAAALEPIDSIDPNVHPGSGRGQRPLQRKIQSPLELGPCDRERCAFALQLAERAHQANGAATLTDARWPILRVAPDILRGIAHAALDQIALSDLGEPTQGQ